MERVQPRPVLETARELDRRAADDYLVGERPQQPKTRRWAMLASGGGTQEECQPRRCAIGASDGGHTEGERSLRRCAILANSAEPPGSARPAASR